MSDRATELETAISEIYGEMQSLQTKVDRLCALARQPLRTDRPDRGIPDLIAPGDAADLANRSKATINRWCAANPLDQPGGFAIWLHGRWRISKSLFLDFLAHDRERSPLNETFER